MGTGVFLVAAGAGALAGTALLLPCDLGTAAGAVAFADEPPEGSLLAVGNTESASLVPSGCFRSLCSTTRCGGLSESPGESNAGLFSVVFWGCRCRLRFRCSWYCSSPPCCGCRCGCSSASGSGLALGTVPTASATFGLTRATEAGTCSNSAFWEPTVDPADARSLSAMALRRVRVQGFDGRGGPVSTCP